MENPILEKIREGLEGLRTQAALRELRLDAPVSFSHNDYLGLSRHPRLAERLKRIAGELPAGSGGSRLLGGHHPSHERAETALARYFDAPAALFFSSGYLANLAAVTALAPLTDGIVSDALNHASLIDGIRLSGQRKSIYPHLKPCRGGDDGTRLWVTESLFSMDGNLVDQAALKAAMAPNDFLLVDEAHAAGVFCEDGRGLTAPRDYARTVVTVTLGKAFGVSGAVLLCAPEVKRWIVNSARSFIYTTSPSPWTAELAAESVAVLEDEGLALRQRLWRRVETTRARLAAQLPVGVYVPTQGLWESRSPVIPLHGPGNDNALRLSAYMREFGVEVRAIRYPTVARGAERLRLSLSLRASDEEMEHLIDTLVKAEWKA